MPRILVQKDHVDTKHHPVARIGGKEDGHVGLGLAAFAFLVSTAAACGGGENEASGGEDTKSAASSSSSATSGAGGTTGTGSGAGSGGGGAGGENATSAETSGAGGDETTSSGGLGGAALVATPVALSAGGNQTCAVVAGGGLKCWGRGDYGQLGNSTWTNSKVPVAVTGLSSGVVAISAGFEHTCALTSAGAVKCWGRNDYGKLGNNSTTDSPVPVNVTGLSSGVVAIGAGYTHTCALTAAGGVKCWGRNNTMGVLGNTLVGDSAVPVDVMGLSSGVVAISVGSSHTCALTSTGALKCWGWNSDGCLGTGSWTDSKLPADVMNLSSGVASVSAGDTHTCALTTIGAGKCWGRNTYGALGNNTLTNSLVPVDVTGLSSGVASISAGGAFTCALTTTGAVKCWGVNSSGTLGNNSPDKYSKVPVDVTGLSSGVVAVSAGMSHACARTSTGVVKCWGENGYGALGNNSTTRSRVPVDVVGL